MADDKMKYAILVGDGMVDFLIPDLGGKTPLEYAQTPNMDRIAAQGVVGRVRTVPDGLPAGSDVANLSLLGYDPARYYSGRAPIEAASLGVPLAANDTAFRCNLVTIVDGRMADYSAGHIETVDAHELIELLGKKLGTPAIRFFPGVSYRHLTVIVEFPDGCACTPPHDISGKEVDSHLPKGPGSDRIRALMNEAHEILNTAPTNASRRDKGKKPATDIWLWGQGHAIQLPHLSERYGISGSVISAVDLVRGLGILSGLTVRLVPGATGYLGTNYAGKVAAAIAALVDEQFVFLHVEAPDETSHEGSLQKKIQAIEEFDKNVVGEMLKYQAEKPGLRILVSPDHATPVLLMTHDGAPVPFAACGEGIRAEENLSYCERAAEGKAVRSGPELFDSLIKGTL